MNRVAAVLLVGLLPVSAISCSDEVPDREPDVRGAVGYRDEYPDPPYLVEPSDDYYLGMSLLAGEPVVVRGRDHRAMSASDLNTGDEVAVWVEGGCAESFPVQCGVVALQVGDAAS